MTWPRRSARALAWSKASASGISELAQAADAFATGGGGGGAGEFGIAGGEPFDFLELDAVPGRIADDGVEAALGGLVLPVAPDAGEGGFPVEEGLFLGY